MFKLIQCADLNWSHFEEYPVWSEFYDFDEIDEIVGWGVDREWLIDQLSVIHSGSNHAAYPVLYTDPLPHRQRLYIRASFETASGLALDGYTIDEGSYAVAIWAHGVEYGFNVNLPDFAREDAARLAKSLGATTEQLFPMRFETAFRMPDDDSPICGTFSPLDPPPN